LSNFDFFYGMRLKCLMQSVNVALFVVASGDAIVEEALAIPPALALVLLALLVRAVTAR